MSKFIAISEEDFSDLLSRQIEPVLSTFKELINQNEHKVEWLTGKEVMDLLKICNTTLHEWSNRGTLHRYKIGRKTLYKKDEVIGAVKRLEVKINTKF